MSDVMQRRPSYLTGCMSPSCVPVHEEYSRIHVIPGSGPGDRSHRGGRRLRRLIRRILSESKSLYGSPQQKPPIFQYDAVSYSQNFDDGFHRDDDYNARLHLQYSSRS